MIVCRTLTVVVVVAGAGAASTAHAGLFRDATAASIGRSTDDPATDGWSNKVELADIDGDGDVDILVANGGDYEAPGAPELSFAYVNDGNGHFTDASAALFGTPALTRVIRAADVDGDGDVDLFMGGAWQTRSRLYMNDGAGGFVDEGADRLPALDVTLGDAKLGDVDGDGDLDIVAADWGDGDPFDGVRGRPLVWLNDGAGRFSDATDAMFPTTKTGMSWDLELVDVDDDLDLDVLVSCKVCVDGGVFLENEGDGTFLDRSGLLPGEGNNYEFEPFDLDGDGFLDLFTVNDGPDLRERVLMNRLDRDQHAFVDASGSRLDDAANPANADDNAAVFFDADGDGDADVLVGSLSDSDRVLLNDGTGAFTAEEDATPGADTPGTLGIAVADLDGDHKLDLVMVQGEQAFGDRIYLGDAIPADTTPPFVGAPAFTVREARDERGRRTRDIAVYARVHDGKSPVAGFDFDVVGARFVVSSSLPFDVPMVHVGEQLWRAEVPTRDDIATVQVFAQDRAGNQAASDAVALPAELGGEGGTCIDECGGGCGSCSAASMTPGGAALLALWCARRRRRPRFSGGAPALPRDSAGAPALPRDSAGAPALPRDSGGAPALPRDSGGAPALPRDSGGAPALPRDSGGAPALPAALRGDP